MELAVTTLFISHSSQDKAWAEWIHAALRGRGYQTLFLDSHPDDGIHAGAKWERTRWQRLRQSRGVLVLCSRHWLSSPWCVAEAMMARERGKPLFLIVKPDVTDGRIAKGDASEEPATALPDFLKDTQFIGLSGLSDEEMLERLWRGLEAEGLKDDFPLPERPHPGLGAFQDTDAAVFFGCDEAIERVRCAQPAPQTQRRGLRARAGSVRLRQVFARARRGAAAARSKRVGSRSPDRLGRRPALPLTARRLAEGHVLLVVDPLEEVFGTAPGSERPCCAAATAQGECGRVQPDPCPRHHALGLPR